MDHITRSKEQLKKKRDEVLDNDDNSNKRTLLWLYYILAATVCFDRKFCLSKPKYVID